MSLQKKYRYINPHVSKIRRSLFDLFLWKAGFYKDAHPIPVVPSSFSYPLPEAPLNPHAPRVTWINHSTFLIQIEGTHLLTDPIWSERCSPLKNLGPKRHHLAPLEIADLPKIDYVLISHNHYDHLDKKSVRKLHTLFPSLTWFVPSGVKKWFLSEGINNVVELGWWEEATVEGLKFTLTPAQHYSGRCGYDLNRTLWGGWVVESSAKRFYFVGDTGYNPHDFKQIGKKWGFMDLSLIPIGCYRPRKFMSPVHVEPKDAVRIHQEVGSKLSLGMHWKTFHLADESPHEPPYDLFLALQEGGIDPLTFLAVEPGYSVNW